MKIYTCANYATVRGDLFAAKLGHDVAAGNRLVSLMRQSRLQVLCVASRYDWIVPVPPRQAAKSRDLALAFAFVVAQRLGTWCRKVLRQSRRRPPLRKMGLAERNAAVRGCYTMREYLSEGVSVLLVDDVATTGSTLRECARVLKAHGAGRVDALVLARVPR